MEKLPKFAELTYERPDFPAWQEKVNALTERAKGAADVDALMEVIREMNELSAQNGMLSELAFIRCFLDSSDEFYAGEMQACSQGTALLDDAPLLRAILDSPCAPQLDEVLGPCFRRALEDQFRLTAQGAELRAKASELENTYQQKKATMRIRVGDKELSEGEVNSLLLSTDRAVRLEAATALHKAFADRADEFQDLLSQMIETRIALAKANGFESYMDYANLSKGRRSYGQKELLDFCRQVKRDMAPLLGEVNRAQAARLGLPTLTLGVDTSLYFPDGNATPIGDGPTLLEAGKEMYDAISAEAAELYRTMVEGGYIDVTSSPNKISNMGFCTVLHPLKMPYIFGNCTGSMHDASTLTHEFGHALQMRLCSVEQPVIQYVEMPNDVVEIPSKAMEQFTVPFSKVFFGKTADKFAYEHMAYTVGAICTFCATHEFESWLYEHPEASPRERVEKYNALMLEYEPGVEPGELTPYLEKGSALFRSMGVFMFPAYVVSYALSDMGALELREQAEEDFGRAWQNYRRLCAAGGSLEYDQLMETAHIHPAYAPGSVARAAKTARKVLDTEG